MHKGRLEAFSDGVLAIIITIMVLELKIPHGAEVSALLPLLPVFLSYILSFIYVGIYWNNHHHLLQATKVINGAVMWANLHLLFWISLIPFATAWMGESEFAKWPLVTYGFVLLMCAVAYSILVQSLVRCSAISEEFKGVLSKDKKGNFSLIFYLLGIPLTFVSPWLALVCYGLVAAVWLIPDRRIEKRIH